MIGGKDNFSGMVPDMDGDGDSDLLDFLILKDILTDEDNPDSDVFRDLFGDDGFLGPKGEDDTTGL